LEDLNAMSLTLEPEIATSLHITFLALFKGDTQRPSTKCEGIEDADDDLRLEKIGRIHPNVSTDNRYAKCHRNLALNMAMFKAQYPCNCYSC